MSACPPLLTSRLRLRRLRASDEADLVALDSDPDVMRHVGSPAGVRAPAETRARARERIGADHEPYGWWRVEDRADGAFHGLGLLLAMPDGDGIEVGYRLRRASWGRGIATEATAALLDYAFSLPGLPALVAVVYPDNTASRRVLEKLGFTLVGPHEYRGARVLRYTLTAETWRTRPGRA